MIVTTSWDDGHPADGRIAAMLSARGMRGTFYIPRQHPFCGTIDEHLVRELSSGGFEIGAHTISHPDLRHLPLSQVEDEARESRDWLQQLTGSAVTMFSYPFGRHNRRVRRVVQGVGFRGARSLRYNALQPDKDLFVAGITVQAADASPLLIARTWLDVRGPPRQLLDWSARAKRAFDVARQRDGVWHLWGHSWEIDRHDDWKRLETVLEYVAGRPGVRYLSNQETLRG